jgi:hypothetical protein
MTILAAHPWRTNGDLIADVHHLGYLNDGDRVLDSTYGKGNWWKQYRPTGLITNDLNPEADTHTHEDFRCLGWADGWFDAAVFDPPYIAQGGRKTSTTQDFLTRYGLHDVPKTTGAVQELINDGLTEITRIVKPRGIVIVKCKDYISGGALWMGTHYTVAHALSIGLVCCDRFEHVGRPGPQPHRPRQLHARRNLSTLLVFRKAKA